MFDELERLQKFDKVTDIIDHYMTVRRDIYTKRKKAQIIALEGEVMVSNKDRFIKEILEETIDLRRKKAVEVSQISAKAMIRLIMMTIINILFAFQWTV